MDTTALLSEIDAEIAKLQHARKVLATIHTGAVATSPKRRGRPPKNAIPVSTSMKRRTMSAEARAKIAAAQRKRWAAQKKVTKKSAN